MLPALLIQTGLRSSNGLTKVTVRTWRFIIFLHIRKKALLSKPYLRRLYEHVADGCILKKTTGNGVYGLL